MDAQSAGKAHVPGETHLALQPVGVLNGREHAVQRRGKPGDTAVQQHRIAGMVQYLFGSGTASVQPEIKAQVQAAERQTVDAWHRRQEGQRGKALGTFDDWPYRFASGMGTFDLADGFRFRQQDANDAGVALTQRQVGLMGPVARRVDAHKHSGLGSIAEKLLKVVARLFLQRLFNGILKVNDDSICATDQCLGYALWAGSRHEQRAAYNLGVHGRTPWANSISPTCA
ncbi:hypothetical protein D3C79_795060 [compost metagenome]